MRRILGKRLHQYLYDQKKRFLHWRTQTKRETKFKALGLKRSLRYRVGRIAQSLSLLGLWKSTTREPQRVSPRGLPSLARKLRPSFLIGPTNSANQGNEWSRALSRVGAKSSSLRISSDPVSEWFTTDLSIDRESWLKLPERIALVQRVASTADVVLFESLRPMFRIENVRDGSHQVLEDLELMRTIGKKVGVIFHGSDIRDVDAHASRYSFSPFNTQRPEIEDLRKRSNENRGALPILRKKKIPIFVSTRDLLREVPDAHWLPVVIDYEKFNRVAVESPIFPTDALRVLYLPSRSWLKSAEIILPILEKLDTEGVIDFIKPAPVPHDQIPEMLAQADLVIDQMMGVIGVFAVEALAAGRRVMSFIDTSDGEDVITSSTPVININPSNLESEIRRVASERPRPTEGPAFAHKWHDGRESARVIGQAFGWKLA